MDQTLIKTAHYHAAFVTRINALPEQCLHDLLRQYGLELKLTRFKKIPGRYWGEDEAGLIENHVYAKRVTPVHSLLHECCHYVCMPPARRELLHTNAGGDYDEENAVCYLQILLAEFLPEYGSRAMLRDMDAWGYSFRLGSAGRWFREDAADARNWLLLEGIINSEDRPTWDKR